MAVYYNEFDPFAAEWLKNLIWMGAIADGDVDSRDLRDVRPSDLDGYTQCHFFAGIGVWSYAARLAGWPDDRPLWTGSCPCQPFSTGGRRAGFADERHLWPAWEWLVSKHRPPTVVGEQVASKDSEPWLDLVAADMETMDYAFGAVAFPSAGVGAPHIRDRTYWLAHRGGARLEGPSGAKYDAPRQGEVNPDGSIGRVANGGGVGREMEVLHPGSIRPALGGGEANELGGDGFSNGRGPTNGLWRNADWLHCRDGKWRPVEPGTSPLAYGPAARVGRLRGYGNAINAEQAAEFLRTVTDIIA